MNIEILHVPDCPNTGAVTSRLAELLNDRPDVTVAERIIETVADAVTYQMAGSPTILIDGKDPFVRRGQRPSLSCRLYPDDDGTPRGIPSDQELLSALSEGRPRSGVNSYR